MEAHSSKSGALPPRNAEAVAHPKPPVHPPVPPPRRSEVVLPPLETQLHPPAAAFRAVQLVSISLPASPGSFGVPTPTAAVADSGDLRRQAMANSAARGPHRLAAQDKGSNSVRFTQPDREAMIIVTRFPGRPERGTGTWFVERRPTKTWYEGGI